MKSGFAAEFSERRISREGALITSAEKETLLRRFQDHVPPADLAGSVAWISEPDPVRFAFLFFHLLDQGYCPVPISPSLPAMQKRTIRESRPGAYIWENEVWTTPRAPASAESGAGCYASMTSGTTSSPKLCELSVAGALENAKAHSASLGIDGDVQVIQSLPVHHSFGLVCYLWTTLLTRCGLDFSPIFQTFKALGRRNLASAVLHVSPSQLSFLNREKTEAPAGLRSISVGGGLADSELLLGFRRKLKKTTNLYVTYGLTEAGPRVSTGLVSDDHFQGQGFIGQAIPGVKAAVLNSEDEIRPCGEGRLCISTPSRRLNPELHELSQDGDFLLTRDHARIDEDGNIFFLGRSEDLIKTGGISVYAQDIEAAVRHHSAVRDCIALKQPDPVYGEVPLLFIETDESDPAIFDEYLKSRLDQTQMPRRIFLTSALPRHSLDKINRSALYSLLEKKEAHAPDSQ